MDNVSLTSADWARIDADGFSAVVGPYLTRGAGADLTVGMIIEPRHCNNHLGTLHGGALMTFADVAFGIATVGVLGGPYCATAQLQVHFVATAKVGEFITCRPEIVRRSKQLVFLRGLFVVDSKIVASVDGIWKVLEPKVRD